MNKINGVEQNEFVFSAALKIIDEVIKLASQHDGQVYGDYVRNVIVPRLTDPLCVCEYDTIEIEFDSAIDTNEFFKALVLKYKDIKSTNNGYDLYVQGMFITHITLSNIYKGKYNFNVDRLVYDYVTVATLYDEPKSHLMFLTNYKPMGQGYLITEIQNKRATVLESVVHHFLKSNNQTQLINTINESYLSKGWTVLFGKHELKDSVTVEQLIALLTKKSYSEEYTLLQNEVMDLQNQLNKVIAKRDLFMIKCLERGNPV